MTLRLRDKFALVCVAVASAAAVFALDYGALDHGRHTIQISADVTAPAPIKKFQDRLPANEMAALTRPAAAEPKANAAEETPAAAVEEAAREEVDPDVALPATEQTAAHDAATHEGTEQEAAEQLAAPSSEEGTEASSWSAETAPAPASQPRVAASVKVQLPWRSRDAAAAVSTKSYTLAERIAEISPTASKRIKEKFDAAKVIYPPAELGLVALKDEKVVELHARSMTGEWQFVHRYKVLAASGKAGPKLKQGDYQVPEGIYGISFLNPNSKYHVAMRVDFPNAFDKEKAAKEGRKALGGDIMIHGKNSSRGCLAMGDEAAEELFVLSESVGLQKVKLVIAPTDFRKSAVPAEAEGQPKWVPELYTQIATAMAPFKAPPSNSLLSLLGL